MNKKNKKNTTLLYAIIIFLSVSLFALAIITFFALNKLNTMQQNINDMQKNVLEMTQTVENITQETSHLYELSSSLSEYTENTPEPQPETSTEEGTLSPPSGSSSIIEDDSLDNLMTQIGMALPQGNGNWSVYVCNLMKDSEDAINNQPMQAASLIKLFIMGAVYENYETLTQQYGVETIDSNLKYMITVSDNDSANNLVTWLGNGDAAAGMNIVNTFCQNHGYTSTHMGRLLLAPNTNDDNYTSVSDCGHFLKEVYQIANKTCTNPTLTSAENMYYLLKLQERRNKIPRNLPEGVHVANKTGELSDVENDVGIIYDTGKVDTVICFMSENLSSVGNAQNTISDLSRQIYSYYNN